MKISLTPQPLPERRGGAKPREFLFPSPFGLGARGEGLRSFHITSVKIKNQILVARLRRATKIWFFIKSQKAKKF
jgi:hypothetical protein